MPADGRKDRAIGPARAVRPLPPFGLATAAALALGVLSVMRLAELPVAGWLVAACIAGVAAWLSPRPYWLRPAGALLFGFGWAARAGQQSLDLRLPPALAGTDLWLTVRIAGLPDAQPGLPRFDAIAVAGEGEAAALVGRRLRLGCYDTAPQLRPGQACRVRVLFNAAPFQRHLSGMRIGLAADPLGVQAGPRALPGLC